MELDPEGVKTFLFYAIVSAVIGLCVGLLFSLISPLAGWIIGSVWATLTLLMLCSLYTGSDNH